MIYRCLKIFFAPFRRSRARLQLLQQQTLLLTRQLTALNDIVGHQARQIGLLQELVDQSFRLFPSRGELGWDDPRLPASLFRAQCIRAQAETEKLIRSEMPLAVCELDHRSFLLAALSRAHLDGAVLEFGVFSGLTLRWMSEAHPDRHFVGFDSFEGLPAEWTGYKTFDFDRKGEPPSLPMNVQLVIGSFEDTLPRFAAAGDPISMIHVDCDLYKSTQIIFDILGDSFRPGTIFVFDEYFNYPGFRAHEHRACAEFLARTGRRIEWQTYCGERAAGVLY